MHRNWPVSKERLDKRCKKLNYIIKKEEHLQTQDILNKIL